MHPLDLPTGSNDAPVDEDIDLELSYEADHFLPPEEYSKDPGRTYFKYLIAVSLILHVSFFVLVPHMVAVSQPKSFIKPGEKVSRVRIVDFLTPKTKDEAPPENASAISDRNHRAQQERLPKPSPTPSSLLGNIAPPPRIAALTPPQAPEDLEKDEQEKLEEQTGPKPTSEKKRQVKKPTETRRPAAHQNNLDRARNRSVDLRPTPQEIARAISGMGNGYDMSADGDADEAIVDINTRENKYFSYLVHLKRKIEAVWVYPNIAAQAGIGGELLVEFLIANNGQLLDVSLMDSSGSSILDDSAVKAIRSAAPYHPFPPLLKTKRLRVRAKFIYITQTAFRIR